MIKIDIKDEVEYSRLRNGYLERISKYYHDRSSYHISSEEGYYFEVDIYIPVEELTYV